MRYFAQVRDLVRSREEHIELSSPAYVDDLVSKAVKVHPAMAEMKQIIRVIVNGRMTEDNIELHDGDTVALLSPVAGGCG